jgi:hypothetical protein
MEPVASASKSRFLPGKEDEPVHISELLWFGFGSMVSRVWLEAEELAEVPGCPSEQRPVLVRAGWDAKRLKSSKMKTHL